MKNKKLVYLLLALSVVVWGWVFLKIYHAFTDDAAPVINKKNSSITSSYQEVKDSFQLLLNYEDPFYKKKGAISVYSGSFLSSASGNTSSSKVVVKKKKNETQVPEIDWSFIHFKGTIKRKATGKTLTLLNIHGEEYSIEEGKEVSKVLLLKNCKDSIFVKYNGVNKYIKKY